MVLLYRAGVPGISGGFVGVDLFFVISGFVITGAIWRELSSTGRPSIPAFYAAWARRILPSAAVVLVFVVLAARATLPARRALQVTRDAPAAALYSINFRFIGEQTSYLHAGAAPSPLLHIWSLAVEEQFYLVWPALLALLWWTARSRSARRTSIAVAGVLVVVVASFALSLHLSSSDLAEAYFSPFSRAWEFELGALLAIAPAPRRDRLPTLDARPCRRGRRGARSDRGGRGAVLRRDRVPGLRRLLPALGAGAIIRTGAALRTVAGERWTAPAARMLAARPLQAIGAISYPLYLWHWALLIVVEGRYGSLSLPLRLAAVFGSAVPANVTLRLVERPIRLSPVLRRSVMGGFNTGVVVMGLSLVVAASVGAGLVREVGGGAALPTPALVTADLAGDPFATVDASTPRRGHKPIPVELPGDFRHHGAVPRDPRNRRNPGPPRR